MRPAGRSSVNETAALAVNVSRRLCWQTRPGRTPGERRMGMKKPKIKLTLVDQKGHMGCHRGHKIGDTFDFDTERGKLCPMAMHVAFPYVDILRYGGKLPTQPDGSVLFCCPDVDVINVFKIEVEEETP